MYETSKTPRKENPRENANIFSLFSFFYTLDIFHKSKHKELEEDDVYKPPKNCVSEKLGDMLENEWKKEVKSGRKSLTKVIMNMFGAEFIYYGCLNLLIKTPINTAVPYATGILVSYFESNSSTTQERAIVCGLTIIAAGIISATYTNFYYVIRNRLSLQIEVALASCIYRKSLRLTQKSLNSVTSGKIVTIMIQDAINACTGCFMFLHDLWTGMVELFIMLLVVYFRIGFSAVLGIVIFLGLIPVQVWLGTKVKQLSLKTLALTDERLRRIQEVLTSIRLIKMYCWENYFTKIVRELRKKEMGVMRLKFFIVATMQAISTLNFRISYFLCIFAYYMTDNSITAEELFFVVTCYKSIEGLLSNAIPLEIAQLAIGKTALERIRSFYLMEEVDQEDSQDKDNGFLSKGEIEQMKGYKYSKGRLDLIMDNEAKNTRAEAGIFLEDVTVKNDDVVIFSDISLKLGKPLLVGITGGTGSGKTTLLKLIMNEVQVNTGKMRINGEISYASQEPWLFPSTIRQNILFGNQFDANRYYQVLKCCALIKDLQKLPERDLTVVSDKGVNLSGGQKARINLARAIYRKADVYLLDNILASLDLNVSKYVFENCIRRFLNNSLCLFVCQNWDYLNAADKVVSIHAGRINITSNTNVEDDSNERIECGKYDNNDCSSFMEEQVPYIKLYKEHKVPGKVLWKDYKTCVRLAGGWMVMAVVLGISFSAQSLGMVFNSYADQWLEVEAKVVNSSYFSNNTLSDDFLALQAERKDVLTIYGIILVTSVLFLVIQDFTFVLMIVRGARNMHWLSFGKIMGATMDFFDRTFAGTIVNRLSKDQALVDEYVGFTFFWAVKNTFELSVTVWLICSINPMLCIPASGLFLVVVYVIDRFLRASRSLRRIEPIVRAPCVGFLNSSLEGVMTIRATGNQRILIGQFDEHQDLYSSSVFMMFMSKHGFGYWLDLIGQIFQMCIIFSFIIFHDKIDNIAGNVGVAVTQALGISGLLKGCILQWAETENAMTGCERVLEYAEAPQEDTSGETPKHWPETNGIEYKNISLQYPNSETRILNDVNVRIEPKQKIGIIGRTGAGKSSLISILFRLYEPDGVLTIGGFDAKRLHLKNLRSKISIIPQDPILFKGTIRSNLDPETTHTDQAIWSALEKVGLKAMLKNFGLTNPVEEAGLNFSIGQRQLFSLARVVLSNNKIVVFDEATANLDKDAEDATRELIKELFADCTLMIIAHRTRTVIGCDKILVVDGGEIVEFGEPEMLMRNNNSYFNSLIK